MVEKKKNKEAYTVTRLDSDSHKTTWILGKHFLPFLSLSFLKTVGYSPDFVSAHYLYI